VNAVNTTVPDQCSQQKPYGCRALLITVNTVNTDSINSVRKRLTTNTATHAARPRANRPERQSAFTVFTVDLFARRFNDLAVNTALFTGRHSCRHSDLIGALSQLQPEKATHRLALANPRLGRVVPASPIVYDTARRERGH
jgi:hypothetical protein